jgi:GNAT superfamily N-acetyltransferase
MYIQEMNSKFKEKLMKSELSKEMKSIVLCDWFVIHEKENKIIGIAGVGGLFNITYLIVEKNFRSVGLGPMLFRKLVNEAKSRGYSYLATYQDPNNINSFKIHKWLNFETIFRIHYSKNIVQDVKFLVLKPKGKIIRRFLKMFNSLFGIIILTSILKIMKGVFPQILGHEIEDLDDVNIRTSIRNFEKI